MPDGKTHAIATVGLGAAVAGVLLYQHQPLTEIAYQTAGTLAGIILTPDLDVVTGSISHRLARRVGCLVGLVWSIIWWPYAMVVGHRSWLSHFPVVGTFLRLFYLGSLLFLLTIPIEMIIWRFGYSLIPWMESIRSQTRPFSIFIFGLMLSDLVHALMDGMKFR